MISDKDLDDLILTFACGGPTIRRQRDVVWQALRELQKRKESDLIPATKFLGLEVGTLAKKVIEECDEVVDEINVLEGDDILESSLKDGQIRNYQHLLEELTDVQFAAETAITKILPDINDRWAVRRQTRDKNNKRGYYEVSK